MDKAKHHKDFKVKILQSLMKGPKTFGELQRELDTKSPTGVAGALTQLQDKNFILRVQKDKRRYHITQQGILALNNDQLLRQISSGGNPGYMEKSQSFPQLSLNVEPVFEEQNSFPFEISLIGDNDIDFQRLVEKISLTLSYLPGNLTRNFAEEVGWQRGLKRPSSLTDPSLPKKFLSETLKWIKKAYDYEITLLLHFNPRQTVNSIEWTKAIKKANETEEKVARGIEILDQDLQEVYQNKEEILKTFVNEYLKAALGEMTFFLESAYNSPLKSDSNIAISEEALLDKITERILHDPFVEGRATKSEIQTILDAILKEGSIKVTSKTIYGIEKREKIP
jgi:hypothetical protein